MKIKRFLRKKKFLSLQHWRAQTGVLNFCHSAVHFTPYSEPYKFLFHDENLTLSINFFIKCVVSSRFLKHGFFYIVSKHFSALLGVSMWIWVEYWNPDELWWNINFNSINTINSLFSIHLIHYYYGQRIGDTV